MTVEFTDGIGKPEVGLDMLDIDVLTIKLDVIGVDVPLTEGLGKPELDPTIIDPVDNVRAVLVMDTGVPKLELGEVRVSYTVAVVVALERNVIVVLL